MRVFGFHSCFVAVAVVIVTAVAAVFDAEPVLGHTLIFFSLLYIIFSTKRKKREEMIGILEKKLHKNAEIKQIALAAAVRR